MLKHDFIITFIVYFLFSNGYNLHNLNIHFSGFSSKLRDIYVYRALERKRDQSETDVWSKIFIPRGTNSLSCGQQLHPVFLSIVKSFVPL